MWAFVPKCVLFSEILERKPTTFGIFSSRIMTKGSAKNAVLPSKSTQKKGLFSKVFRIKISHKICNFFFNFYR